MELVRPSLMVLAFADIALHHGPAPAGPANVGAGVDVFRLAAHIHYALIDAVPPVTMPRG